MKRNLIRSSSLVVLSLLLAAAAIAQTRVSAAVPFAFQVRGQQLPAGTYSISKGEGTNIITIQSHKNGSSVMTLATPGLSGNKSYKLVFNHVGGKYFLSQVWGEAGSSGMLVPASKVEKELEVARVTPKADSNVEIALK